MTLMIKKLE